MKTHPVTNRVNDRSLTFSFNYDIIVLLDAVFLDPAARDSPIWPYSARNGSNAQADIAAMLAPPAIRLSAVEKRQASQFAVGLFHGRYQQRSCASLRSLEKLYRLSALASQQNFYLGYFDDPSSLADRQLLDLADRDPRRYLVEVERLRQSLTPRQRKQIALNSQTWFRKRLAACLDKAVVDKLDDRQLVVHYDPDKLLDLLADLQAYRDFYRQLYLELKTRPDSRLRQAKLALINVHMGRVNAMLADLYASAVQLARQLDLSQPGRHTERWLKKLAAVASTVGGVFSQQYDDREQFLADWMDDVSRRLDFVRNGAASTGQRLTAVSDELVQAVKRRQNWAGQRSSCFTAATLALLDATRWNAGQLSVFLSRILRQWGILSQHASDWHAVDSRDGWAPDDKWQVVIRPGLHSLMVDGSKKVLLIPADFNRSLTQVSPAGVLPVSAHELTHVLQTEYDIRLSQTIPLARVKGRRYVTMREMGSLQQEAKLLQAIGRDRDLNLHYLAALRAKERGGSLIEVVRTFYESCRGGAELSRRQAARLRDYAVDRSLRLYREGGHNSQPLDYVEQQLIVDALRPLPPQQRDAIALAGSSFALADAVQLHTVDLLNLPEAVEERPAETVLNLFQARYLPRILAYQAQI